MVEFYTLEPPIAEGKREIVFGDSLDRQQDLVLVGKLAERGLPKSVWLDISGEQVIAIVGKRGTGKSFTLGVLLEGLCLGHDESTLARITHKRAILLLDTVGVFWTMAFKLQPKGPQKMVEQYRTLEKWNIEPRDLNVDVWVPAGFGLDSVDPVFFKTFYLNVSDLDAGDWATLLDVDLIMEPRGQLVNEVWSKVVIEGWRHKGEVQPPKRGYSVDDLIECTKGDDDVQDQYNPETIRAVLQRLISYRRFEMMKAEGTRLTDMLKAGTLSVLLVNRLGDNLRTVVASVLIRKIMSERGAASFITKRLKTDPNVRDEEREALQRRLHLSLPRTWIAVDEAQNLIPSERKTYAQETLVKLVKEGRNIGLSFALTTQQPNAIDSRIMSQVETFVIHQLTTRQDLDNVRANLKSAEPESIKSGGQELDFLNLIRGEDLGQALVSNANSTKEVPRTFLINVRPRVTVHGGFED